MTDNQTTKPRGRRKVREGFVTSDKMDKTVVVEVDGAVHLLVRTYWDDMDRQNAFTLQGDRILRYPTMAFYL